MNFTQFLEMHSRGGPDRLALVDQRVRLSYAELNGAASRFADVLTRRGLRPGDRLALLMPNRAEIAVAFLGALKAGVVAVPLNWRLHGQDLEKVLAHCAPACLVTTEERMMQGVAASIGWVLGVAKASRSGSFWDALEGGDPACTARPCQNAEIANLLYTSGTTGMPKAAIHTHGMRVSIAAAMADCFALSSGDVGLMVSPMFHTSGMSVFSNAIFAGGAVVMLDRWDLDLFVDAIERERVTFMHLIATIIVDIARAPASAFARVPPTVRFTWGGGHSVDPAIFETFERRVGGVLLQGYSRTEGGLTYNPLDGRRRRFDSHGLPNRNSSDLAIIDVPGDRLCGPGKLGEIAFRGDGISPGYWDDGAVRPGPTMDGWSLTGDSGRVDADGTLHFLGRADDMIKTGGENVYPSEVSRVLLALSQIADAVVLGLPDERLGQRVAALIVPADPALLVADIDKACRSALAGFKIPRTIGLTQVLPRLATQKVDVAACRAILLQTQE